MLKLNKPLGPDISIIFTGYNEGADVLRNLNRVKNLLNTSRYSWEMILYDDKSSDKTLDFFKEFADTHKNVSVFFHKNNLGRGRTVKDAILKSKGNIVGYIDTDLELSPVYIFEFILDLLNGADVAIARRYYTIKGSNLIRAVASKVYPILADYFLNLHFQDTEAGFKFFKRRKILPILRKVRDERWFFDTEILARSLWAGLKIVEIPVVYIRNPEKKSSVKLIKDSVEYLRKIWYFRKEANKRHANCNSYP